MAGHSHWKNIKRKKEAQDKKKSLLYSKAAHMIINAIKAGGGNTNPESNLQLKIALEFAKSVKFPKDNIQRLLKKYSQKESLAALKSVIYEVMGPGNVPVLVQVTTDNTNRTLTCIRTALRKLGGRLADKGAIMWQFKPVGVIKIVPTEGMDPEGVILEVLDLVEAEDAEAGEEEVIIKVGKDLLNQAAQKLVEAGFKVVDASVNFEFVGNAPSVDKEELEEFISNLQQECDEIEQVWVP